jgi:hypothetical protein
MAQSAGSGAAAAGGAGGALSFIAPVLSLGGLLDGLSPMLQLLVLALVVFHVSMLSVWVVFVSSEVRTGRRLRKAAD